MQVKQQDLTDMAYKGGYLCVLSIHAPDPRRTLHPNPSTLHPPPHLAKNAPSCRQKKT
ncbi:hypothetical protein T484DRAFT_1931299 [Baffinella frigidus]|nr:hypothetical protein T484DRAFT_1931299 [Cryptophyta sp. CCMP2293]